MKVAFLEINATTSFGGVQTGVWNFAREFTRKGHDVTVIGGVGKIGNPYPDAVKAVTFPFIDRARFPGLGLPFPFQKFAERLSFALGRGVRAAVRQGGFDWVILHKPLDFFWPWLPGVRRTTRFAFYSGGTDFLPFDRTLARKVKAMFACSNFNAWQITEHFLRGVKVTYNGVDTERFAPGPERATVRAAHGFEANEVVFGFTGRLIDLKGVDCAIRALAEEPLRGLPVRLALAGDGPMRGELERMAAALGVAERVKFVGAMAHSAVPAFLNACDVGIFPSMVDEAFGTSIAEAMSCGIPVVGSYVGGIPEVVGNEGTCGLLCPPGDIQALAAAMRGFAASPQIRCDAGSKARERIRQNFTWRHAAERLLDGLSESGRVRTPNTGPAQAARSPEQMASGVQCVQADPPALLQ